MLELNCSGHNLPNNILKKYTQKLLRYFVMYDII